MTIIKILEEIRQALLDSQALNDFCLTHYDKLLQVFLGADERDLPQVDNCPFVILDRAKARYTERNQIREVDGEFFVFICICQEEKINDRGIIYKGVKELDELSQLVRQQICRNVRAPIIFTESEIPSIGENAPLRRYPFYVQLERGVVKLREKRDGG